MPRVISFNRCQCGGHMLAVEDRSGGGSKKLLGGSGHNCQWTEIWRYGFLPAEFAAKLLEFEDRDELPNGTIVQVMVPAADGTTGMVGMVGIVTPFEPGEVCDIPDAGGVPVYFNWPDDGIHGRVARSRLRVVGHTSFVPVGPWTRGGISTVDNDSITTSTDRCGMSDADKSEEDAARRRLAAKDIDAEAERRKFAEDFYRRRAEPLNANTIRSLREWIASWPLEVESIPTARSTLIALIDAAEKSIGGAP